MVKLFLAILFLVQRLQHNPAGFCQLPQSPCPKYFRYYQDEMSGEMMGMVEIPSPLPRGVALMLRVTLNFPAVLPLRDNGNLELVKSKNDYAPVQQAIDQGRSLFFRIKFPVQRPLPVLKEITFNNQPKCVGPAVNSLIVTSIQHEKILYPPELLSLLFNKSKSNNFPVRFEVTELPKFSTLPPPTNTMVPISTSDSGSTKFYSPEFSTFKLSENCGLSQNANLSIDIRFVKGVKTYPGQWPWLAAIFITSEDDFDFQCVGNLVSIKHIITAAHCVKPNGANVSANEFLVLLGKYFIDIPDETGSLEKKVSEIRVHPDFHKTYPPNADSDLAILVLQEPVEYNLIIQPVCLWNKPNDLDDIVGEKGIVVGWGKLGNRYVGEPRLITTRIVSRENCLHSNPKFISVTSNRTFCAGNRNGRGPCSGDSGSGFLMLDPETGRYHIRGIVSLSLLDEETMSCDLKQYIVYVDLAKHQDWIEKQISSDLE